jgi:GNAT superfamily N-acetyltransferase
MLAGMGWRVRRAEVADADRLGVINVLGWQTTYRGIIPQPVLDAMTPSSRADIWRRRLELPEANSVFVAVGDDDTAAAYCLVGAVRKDTDRHPELPTGELLAIYADPALRGQGAGHAVHDAAIVYLGRHGFRHAVLWVFEANTPSREFYLAHGWAPDGGVNQDKFGEAEVTEVRYARTLGVV